MSNRIFLVLLCAFVLELLSVSARGQNVLHYSFKPGEQLKYHYKVSRTLDAMRKRGLNESVTNFEADPEWSIKDVSLDGEARAILTNRERSETYRTGHARMNALHFTPQCELAIDRNGKLLFAHILIDDTQRTLTKELKAEFQTLSLMSDYDAVLPHFERLWYTFDPMAIDPNGIAKTISWDSISARPYEHDSMVWGRRDTLLTARVDTAHQWGTKGVALIDTVVNNSHFWKLSVVEDGNSFFVKFPERTQTHWHRTSELLFRKEDDILQSWHYILDTHFNGGTVNSEMWLTLTSIEGS